MAPEDGAGVGPPTRGINTDLILSSIKSSFFGPCFVLALAGIRRLVVQIKAMENDVLVLLRSEADMIAMRLQKTEQELDRLRVGSIFNLILNSIK